MVDSKIQSISLSDQKGHLMLVGDRCEGNLGADFEVSKDGVDMGGRVSVESESKNTNFDAEVNVHVDPDGKVEGSGRLEITHNF